MELGEIVREAVLREPETFGVENPGSFEFRAYPPVRPGHEPHVACDHDGRRSPGPALFFLPPRGDGNLLADLGFYAPEPPLRGAAFSSFRLRRFPYRIAERDVLVFVGQCPDCGAIWWAGEETA